MLLQPNVSISSSTPSGEQDPVSKEQYPIRLTVNSSTLSPGQTVIFKAEVPGVNVVSVILTDRGNIQLPDEVPPYEWVFPLKKSASGAKTFSVVALSDDRVIESNRVTVTLLPDLSLLRELVFEPGTPEVLFPGFTHQLYVSGQFADGFNRDLTQSAMGTKYQEVIVDGVNTFEGDSNVISVTPEGLVRGEKVGIAEVKAVNSGKSTTRRIVVEEQEP